MPKPYVELSRDDAAVLGIKDGDMVKVAGNGAQLELPAKVDIRLPKGLLFVPYHFTESGLNRMYKGESAIAVKVSK
jgi:NADH-quinone oxidoreductase subunit G